MNTRANTTNSLGIGVSQVSGGNVATANTFITTFPRPAGQTITVTQAIESGTTVGDNVERDSDGGLWDTVAGVAVAWNHTSLSINDMLSN
jgi:hypothetical protein